MITILITVIIVYHMWVNYMFYFVTLSKVLTAKFVYVIILKFVVVFMTKYYQLTDYTYVF